MSHPVTKLLVAWCCFIVFFFAAHSVFAQSTQEACNADIDQNGFVDISDYSILVRDFLRNPLLNPRSNINRDTQNIVDLSDYTLLVRWFLKTVSCSTPSPTTAPLPTPTGSPIASGSGWTQDAHDAQRTGVTNEEPGTPWTYQWSFNGPDSNGGFGNHLYDAPNEARTVVGNGKLYAPAGTHGLYALTLTGGQTAWTYTGATFLSAPVFDPATQSVFAGATDGKVYKIDSTTGTVSTSFATGSKIRKTPLLVGSSLYVVTDAGTLYKLNTTTLQSMWSYAAGSRIDTPPSYSSTRDSIVFAANNLYVYAVNNANGSLKWKVKPSPNTPGGTNVATRAGASLGAQFEYSWPVIAEKHGVVLVRMQLDTQAHFEGPNSGRFGSTNAESRSWLQANPQWRDLFALNLDDGAEKFIPAAGYGSTEDVQLSNGSSYGVMGAQPIVKTHADGSEVVYIQFRSYQVSSPDFRWSGALGEMVLDNTTVPGMVAGDLRFVQMDSSQLHIIDEQNPLTMGGNMLFHSHWSAVEGAKILDRSSSKGLTKSNPISTSILPRVARAIKPCGTFSSTSHYSSCTGFSYVTDGGRSIAGPGFYQYWNVADPPGWSVGSGNVAGTSYSSGFMPRYTYVSNGYIIVEGNGGDILVLKHS